MKTKFSKKLTYRGSPTYTKITNMVCTTTVFGLFSKSQNVRKAETLCRGEILPFVTQKWRWRLVKEKYFFKFLLAQSQFRTYWFTSKNGGFFYKITKITLVVICRWRDFKNLVGYAGMKNKSSSQKFHTYSISTG